MEMLWIMPAALGIGLAAGVVVALRRRGPDPSLALEGWFEAHAAELRRLGDAAQTRDGSDERLRAEMRAARSALEELRIQAQERRESEVANTEVVKRLAGVLAGGASKGRGGENVLREHLAELPPGMLVTDFRVNGKVVEFGLALPDGRRLPIDSKWPALRELEELESAVDPKERDAAARCVERVVAGRAREVAQYLDPAVTAPVAVAAIPDAAYEVLRRAHADAFSHGVVLVPYSCALPVVLFLYSLVSSYGQTADVQSCLSEIAGLLETMESVIENKLARSAVVLSNATGELRAQVGRARGSIARARSTTEDPALSEGAVESELLRVVD
jgi:DNA recombination protein RmuC